MPAPPTQIHIKRKFEDDTPEFLHVHHDVNGVRPNRQYIFKRTRISAPNENISTPSTNPVLFTGRQTAIKAQHVSITQAAAITPQLPEHHSETTSKSTPFQSQPQNAISTSGHKPQVQSQEPRRFYMSRATEGSNKPGLAGVIQGKAPPKVFMEKKPNRGLTNTSLSSRTGWKNVTDVNAKKTNEHIATANQTAPSPPTTPTPRPQAPLRNTRLPSGRIMPWDATATKLASEMQAYTLKEIAANITETPKSQPTTTHSESLHKKSPSRFKPNPPPPRYLDRHPRESSYAPKKESEDENMIDTVQDESGYVLDTYIRMPLEMFESFGNSKNFGLLVLDSQPDIDEFYNDDSDDDSEIFDEEEDENAENHHSTDYPDEEVDSDDEYGRNPYLYRNRNASDEEEFDEDDATFSDDNDDDDESRKPAWARRTWKMGKPVQDEVEEDVEI